MKIEPKEPVENAFHLVAAIILYKDTIPKAPP